MLGNATARIVLSITTTDRHEAQHAERAPTPRVSPGVGLHRGAVTGSGYVGWVRAFEEIGQEIRAVATNSPVVPSIRPTSVTCGPGRQASDESITWNNGCVTHHRCRS